MLLALETPMWVYTFRVVLSARNALHTPTFQPDVSVSSQELASALPFWRLSTFCVNEQLPEGTSFLLMNRT